MYSIEKKYYKKAFFTALIMAAVMFLPFVIIDGGYFLFYGDYDAQQIPFFKHSVEMVHNGTLGWDWHTDLGANFIGSYTYYTLGSPFFWFMCLFPASISHYLMAPLLCVKIALFSLFAFIYIRRFVKKPQTALIGGILYAFSSFNLYNIFFQFQDAMIWFPLLLIGLEEFVVNKRKCVFILAVALNCLANYFFFISEVIFLVIYFFIRMLMDKNFRINIKEFLLLAFESVGGVMTAGILFIPSIYQVLDVPRSTSILNGWDFIFFSNKQRAGLLVESLFFPPEIAARNLMFTEANARWSSVALYIPLFSMAGVAAFFRGAKKHWITVLLSVCLLMAFVPGFNAAFSLLNDNYYTRWFFMPELIICLATCIAVENSEKDESFSLRFGLKICVAATILVGGLALLTPFEISEKDEAGKEVKSIVPRFISGVDARVFLAVGIGAAFMITLGIMLRLRRKYSERRFMKKLFAVTVVCSMVLGFYFVGLGRFLGSRPGRYDQALTAEFDLDEDGFFRIEGVNETNNFAMFSENGSLKSFTSIIPGSTFEFYNILGYNRTVNSAPANDWYAVRALTRVKYIMFHKDTTVEERRKQVANFEMYEFYERQGNYDIYKTDLALPMGFAYDTYFRTDNVKNLNKPYNLMVRSVFLTEEQVEKYSDILKYDDSASNISYAMFKVDARAKIAAGVDEFIITDSGFTSKTSYEEEKLVCFSVPYCTGWSAEINGVPVEVDKINGGLIGIRVPAGNCDIVFRYETPGLKTGIILTFIGLALWALYAVYIYKIKKEKPRRYCHLYPREQLSCVGAHAAYTESVIEKIRQMPAKNAPAKAQGAVFDKNDSEDNVSEEGNDEAF